MKTVVFTLEEHEQSLLVWAHERGSYIPSVSEIPGNGIVVLNNSSQPICLGFIRKVEGGYGLIDGYISDPSQPAIERNEALSLLTEELIKLAKQLGMSALLANTVDEHTLKRSLKHGFSQLPHSLMVKDLKS